LWPDSLTEKGNGMDRQKVKSRDDLIDLIFELLDDNDAVLWKNDNTYRFLQAMAAWLNATDPKIEPTWQMIADMLDAAGK
jgi:hypothetical protein